MLIKVTNYCSMGCWHCMENSTVAGEHMTKDVFLRALDFTERLEAGLWERGLPKLLLLSGGECSEHPEFPDLVDEAVNRGFTPLLITNGMWLGDAELRLRVLPPGRKVLVQVVNDPRFYPKAPLRIVDGRIAYIDHVAQLVPIGRARGKKPPQGMTSRSAPASFNVRSLTRSFGDVRQALLVVRTPRAAKPMGDQCAPSVSWNGDFVAGENIHCFKVGTVDSTAEEVTRNILAMGECNRCGLEAGLSQNHKVAIGLAKVVTP